MDPERAEDHIDEFVCELLRAGFMLSDLGADLAESLPADAYPDEEPGAVILQMMCGTIRTAVESADPRDVRRATELIEQAVARTLEHLRLACELSRRMHGDGGSSPGRAYG
jgi:hypothetical protein